MLTTIQENLQIFLHRSPITIALNVILFLFLIELIYQFYCYEKQHRSIYTLNQNIKQSFLDKEKSLKQEFEEIKEKDGNFTDKNKSRKITKLLNDSGLKIKFPELTAEMFVILLLAIAILVCFISFMVTKSILVTVITTIASIFLVLLYLEQRKTKINKSIERDLLKFIDLLVNMSRTEKNLAEMFKGSAQYLDGPLKSLVIQSYYEMVSTGNTIKALQNFSDQANHSKLKEVLNYLLICSQKNESYEEVMFEIKESIRTYIAYNKSKEEIKKSGLVDLLIMGIGGCIIVFALSSMIPNTFVYLFHTMVGQLLLIMSSVVLIFAIWSIYKTED